MGDGKFASGQSSVSSLMCNFSNKTNAAGLPTRKPPNKSLRSDPYSHIALSLRIRIRCRNACYQIPGSRRKRVRSQYSA